MVDLYVQSTLNSLTHVEELWCHYAFPELADDEFTSEYYGYDVVGDDISSDLDCLMHEVTLLLFDVVELRSGVLILR